MSNYTKTTNFAVKDGYTSGNPSKVVKGTELDAEFVAIASAITSKADLASPAFTGAPTAPTATTGTNTTQVATTAFVKTAVDASAATAAPLDSPAFVGTPTAPTASSSTNTTQLATTAFVQTAVSDKALQSTTITAGTGLTGGGSLAANRTISIASGSNGYGTRTVSASAPSGGNDGDVWYVVS
jgi:hypothetical protein